VLRAQGIQGPQHHQAERAVEDVRFLFAHIRPLGILQEFITGRAPRQGVGEWRRGTVLSRRLGGRLKWEIPTPGEKVQFLGRSQQHNRR
jgi:hypothetical protein